MKGKMTKQHDNPYTTPTNIGGVYYRLLGICGDECLAWYKVGQLHERNLKAFTSPKRLGLFHTVHCVWVDIHYKDEEQWTYTPIKQFPYYQQMPRNTEGGLQNEMAR